MQRLAKGRERSRPFAVARQQTSTGTLRCGEPWLESAAAARAPRRFRFTALTSKALFLFAPALPGAVSPRAARPPAHPRSRRHVALPLRGSSNRFPASAVAPAARSVRATLVSESDTPAA